MCVTDTQHMGFTSFQCIGSLLAMLNICMFADSPATSPQCLFPCSLSLSCSILSFLSFFFCSSLLLRHPFLPVICGVSLSNSSVWFNLWSFVTCVYSLLVDRPPSSELLISGTDSRPVVRYAGHHRQVNRELILTCQSWDNTDGLTLETLWYHNDVLIKQGTQHFNFGWRNRTLLFRDNPFVTSMSGNYSCSVNYKGFPEINVTRTDPISVFIRG